MARTRWWGKALGWFSSALSTQMAECDVWWQLHWVVNHYSIPQGLHKWGCISTGCLQWWCVAGDSHVASEEPGLRLPNQLLPAVKEKHHLDLIWALISLLLGSGDWCPRGEWDTEPIDPTVIKHCRFCWPFLRDALNYLQGKTWDDFTISDTSL